MHIGGHTHFVISYGFQEPEHDSFESLTELRPGGITRGGGRVFGTRFDLSAAGNSDQPLLRPHRGGAVSTFPSVKKVLANEKAQLSSSVNQEVDLDDLMDDPDLERLHADRIASLKKKAEKRQKLTMQGHGEYKEITEGDFLSEVTGSEKVICHFYHR